MLGLEQCTVVHTVRKITILRMIGSRCFGKCIYIGMGSCWVGLSLFVLSFYNNVQEYWLLSYFYPHSCLNEAVEKAVLPCFEGCLGEIKIPGIQCCYLLFICWLYWHLIRQVVCIFSQRLLTSFPIQTLVVFFLLADAWSFILYVSTEINTSLEHSSLYLCSRLFGFG